MVDKWHTAKVDEIAEKVAMGPFGSSIKVSTFIDEGIPIISGKHLHGIKLEDSEFNFISYDHAERLKNANVYRGDIVFTHAGNIGQVAYIPESSKYKKYILSQRQFYMRCDRRKVLPEFVTYFFKTPEGQHRLLANTSQTGVPSIAQPVSYLKTIEIPLPPLPEQKAIAHILGTLDDKIELNRKINETLEAMARAIFKSWFVDFDPIPGLGPHKEWQDSPLGKIPKGWRVGTLGDICNARGGFAYKSEDFCDKGYPVIKIKNIDLDRTVNIDDVEHIPENIALETQDFWLSDGDVVMAMTGATVGKFGLIVNRGKFPAILNQRVAKFFPFKKYGAMPWFIYNTLRSQEIIDQIISIADGSAQPNISANGIMSQKIVVPDDRLIKEFNSRVDCMFKQIISNQKQSLTLAAIRDALLPKLLSGEILIPEAEKLVEGVV